MQIRNQLRTSPAIRSVLSGSRLFAFRVSDSDRLTESRLFSDSCFQALLEAKIVRVVRIRGRIPESDYQNHQLEQAIAFVQLHQLDTRRGWRDALVSHNWQQQVMIWATEWRVSADELRRTLYTLRAPDLSSSLPYKRDVCVSDSSFKVADHSQLIARATEFTARFQVPHQQFVNFFFSGQHNAEDIAQALGCSHSAAASMLQEIAQIDIEEVQQESKQIGSCIRALPPSATPQIVADIIMDDSAGLKITLRPGYLQTRFVVNEAEFRVWLNHSPEQRAIARSIQKTLYHLNDEAGTAAAIIHTMCTNQAKFLGTADSVDRVPLSQAEVARQSGCHRSVVCRFLPDNAVAIGHRRVPLVDMILGHGEALRRIFQTQPDWSDREVACYAHEHWGLSLSRRTINYHRHSFSESTP